MLSLNHVSKFIISDMSIHIPKGVAVGIIGTSGAGKTTFLKLACGLLSPEEGEVYTLQRNPLENRSILGKHMGCLLERMPVFDGERSVADNLKDLQIIYQLEENEFAREYGILVKRLGVQEFEKMQVKSLSFGQRRRAELAAVLLHRPKLLLLDEPSNGLDENAKQVMKELLIDRMKAGMSVVLTSHNMREVSELCGRIALLDKGKLLYYGEESTLLRNYAPWDTMHLKITGKLPDMEELPLKEYMVDGEKMVLTYNSNYITAPEILEVILRQTSVSEVAIRKPDLTDVILAVKESVTCV